MPQLHKHVILIGFKHVGKSSLGEKLATTLQLDFIDLDKVLEHEFSKLYQANLSCRDIMTQYGEPFFRTLEKDVLQQTLSLPPAIIALGGGTPFLKENQALLSSQFMIHITANPNSVFERIKKNNIPAFFPQNKNPQQAFQDLWIKRDRIYKMLTNHVIFNDFTLEETVNRTHVLLKNLRVLEAK